MNVFTTIALVAALIHMIVAAAAFFGERGPRVDLRKHGRRRGPRAGGRRAEDLPRARA